MSKIPIEADCPYCGEQMTIGEARVHSTALGILFVGMSNQHLSFFKKGKKTRRVLSSGHRIKAHHCESCGATVIPQAKGGIRWLD